MVALVEEYEAEEEEDVKEAIESDHEDKDELTMPDHGTSLVVQRSLKIGATGCEENWLRSNVFHTRCTSKDRVCLVIIDSGSFENCVSLEMVQNLDLKMDQNFPFSYFPLFPYLFPFFFLSFFPMELFHLFSRKFLTNRQCYDNNRLFPRTLNKQKISFLILV